MMKKQSKRIVTTLMCLILLGVMSLTGFASDVNPLGREVDVSNQPEGSVIEKEENSGVDDNGAEEPDRTVEVVNAEREYREVPKEVISSTGQLVESNSRIKNKQEIEQYVISFMRGGGSNSQFTTYQTVPLYNLEEGLTGYYVMLSVDGEPSAYALVSFLDVNTPIVDLSLEGIGVLGH